MPPKTNLRREKRCKFNEDTTSGSTSLQRRFVSKRAKEMFDFIKTSRKPICERGFDIVRNDCEEVFDMIGSRNWEKYCEPPNTANVSLVREFYANALERNDYKVFVRGKTVSFDPITINNHFNLEDLPDNDFASLERNPDFTDILRTLCDTEVDWKISRGEIKSFLSNCLSLPMALWYLFITARLMPVTHLSDVTKERAILLFALKRGIYLNIGKMISKAILCNISNTKIGLYFPSLISTLCLRESISTRPDDEWKQPTQPINYIVINRLFSNRSNRLPSSRRPHTMKKEKSTKQLTINERVNLVESNQEELKEWAKYQTSYNQYNAESMTSMDSLLRGIASNLNLDMNQFPSTSVCPSHFKFKEQVEDVDDDEDDENDDEEDDEDDDEDDENDDGEEE